MKRYCLRRPGCTIRRSNILKEPVKSGFGESEDREWGRGRTEKEDSDRLVEMQPRLYLLVACMHAVQQIN